MVESYGWAERERGGAEGVCCSYFFVYCTQKVLIRNYFWGGGVI